MSVASANGRVSDPFAGLVDALAEAVADRAAERLAADLGHLLDRTALAQRWLDVAEAAEYLRCKPKRIYDLVSQRRITPARDGSRLLFDRGDLDRYLTDGRD